MSVFQTTPLAESFGLGVSGIALADVVPGGQSNS